MYKNLMGPAAECLENGNYHVYRKLFHQRQHFFKNMDPSSRKLQEPKNKQTKLKDMHHSVILWNSPSISEIQVK